MARAKKTKAKSRTISLDFTGVDLNRFRPPEGDYHCEIIAVEQGESSNGNDQLEVDFKILDGKFEDKEFRMWFSLVPEALWKVGGFLTSLGIEVPKDELELDLDEMVEKKIGIIIEDREYDGKTKPDIADHYPLEEEAEEPAAKKGKTGKKTEPEEPEPKKGKKTKGPPKLSTEEVKAMDEDELGEVVTNYDLDDTDLDDYKTLRKKQAAVLEALEAKDMLEE